MRDAISKESTSNQHAINMQSACNQHAVNLQSACNQSEVRKVRHRLDAAEEAREDERPVEHLRERERRAHLPHS